MTINSATDLKKFFKDQKLFSLALTHRSWVNEHNEADGQNERLEFLGDAVLEYVVSAYLYYNFPEKEEGFLTALRSNIVNTINLSKFAKRVDLGPLLKLSKGEESGGGRTNDSLLANTIEALIGALYIDQGLSAAEEFIKKNLLTDIDEKLQVPLKDAKSRLQELVQSQGYTAPRYTVVSEEGPDHNKQFTVQVSVGENILATGEGKSKNRAQQEAAEQALVKFEAKK